MTFVTTNARVILITEDTINRAKNAAAAGIRGIFKFKRRSTDPNQIVALLCDKGPDWKPDVERLLGANCFLNINEQPSKLHVYGWEVLYQVPRSTTSVHVRFVPSVLRQEVMVMVSFQCLTSSARLQVVRNAIMGSARWTEVRTDAR